MIISQTPYRVSFVGGGTDLPAFFHEEPGAVVSTAIDKHMYVTVSNRFERSTRVGYTRTEICDDVSDIQHTIVRAVLRRMNLGRHLEITTIGDVPGGTGMGSSSSLTVGLLNALYAWRGRITSHEQLAAEASDIELNVLRKPIGKQDQYAAAYGGLQYIRFNPDESVEVEPIPARPEVLAELERSVLLLYTGQQRDANDILRQQSAGTRERMSVLRKMRDLAEPLRQSLSGPGNLAEFARILDEAWQLKKSLGFGIDFEKVNQWYHTARKLGAQGGKLLGAGGGGFLLLIAPRDAHERLRAALGNPRELAFGMDQRGSRIIFIHNRPFLRSDD